MTGAGRIAPVEPPGPATASPLHLPDDEPFEKFVGFNFGGMEGFFSAAVAPLPG